LTRGPVVRTSSALATGIALFAVMWLSACARGPLAQASVGPGYRPANIYRAQRQLPASLRRIAVLPMSVEAED